MSKLHVGETCGECGSPVRPIMWGMPTDEGLRDAESEGWHVGGCCIDERMSTCECGATAYDDEGQRVPT